MREAIGISRERNNISRERNIIARERNRISRERNICISHDPSGAPYLLWGYVIILYRTFQEDKNRPFIIKKVVIFNKDMEKWVYMPTLISLSP